jgi:hypothetical protein
MEHFLEFLYILNVSCPILYYWTLGGRRLDGTYLSAMNLDSELSLHICSMCHIQLKLFYILR